MKADSGKKIENVLAWFLVIIVSEVLVLFIVNSILFII